ncbi:hypothetical protein FA13DRAFT_60024 [Coprinellus micaceus]|uniref:Uncharacterized protein n=1 Tax=Coprinellus micaceus TaxID=71717 RepID=A0A4Y7U1C4_COPMI|nr:hypothetical protein FA13DRAFT_60024 [Coprinellus micaceus]
MGRPLRWTSPTLHSDARESVPTPLSKTPLALDKARGMKAKMGLQNDESIGCESSLFFLAPSSVLVPLCLVSFPASFALFSPPHPSPRFFAIFIPPPAFRQSATLFVRLQRPPPTPLRRRSSTTRFTVTSSASLQSSLSPPPPSTPVPSRPFHPLPLTFVSLLHLPMAASLTIEPMPNPFAHSYGAYLTANDLTSLSSARPVFSVSRAAVALVALGWVSTLRWTATATTIVTRRRCTNTGEAERREVVPRTIKGRRSRELENSDPSCCDPLQNTSSPPDSPLPSPPPAFSETNRCPQVWVRCTYCSDAGCGVPRAE